MMLFDYWPRLLQKIRDFEELASAVQPELNIIIKHLNALPEEYFLNHMTRFGVERWEEILKIIPPKTDTLDDRRFRVIARLGERLPYTYRTMIKYLAVLCGEENFEVNLDHNNYYLLVKLALQTKSQYDSVVDMLRRMVPANLILDVQIMYNRHIDLRPYEHDGLGEYTHEGLREDESIVNG